ncbi:MAG: hypothetical protein KAT05_00135 [Spirochaetes bacterium]|nr:hypothetical protein [Spirochaetota bacterium]
MYREFEKYLIKPSEGREELNKYLDKIFLFLNNSISLKDEDYHRYFFDNEYFLNNPIREEYRSSFYYYFLKEFRKDQNFHKLLQSSWKEVSRNSIKHIQDKLNEIPEEQLKSVGLLGVQLKLKTNTFNKFIKIFGNYQYLWLSLKT